MGRNCRSNVPVRSGAFNYSGIMFCAYISHFALGDLLGVFYHIGSVSLCGKYVCNNATL